MILYYPGFFFFYFSYWYIQLLTIVLLFVFVDSTSAKLELFSLDLGVPGPDTTLVGSVNTPHRQVYSHTNTQTCTHVAQNKLICAVEPTLVQVP